MYIQGFYKLRIRIMVNETRMQPLQFSRESTIIPFGIQFGILDQPNISLSPKSYSQAQIQFGSTFIIFIPTFISRKNFQKLFQKLIREDGK